jgi:hypothetical protein
VLSVTVTTNSCSIAKQLEVNGVYGGQDGVTCELPVAADQSSEVNPLKTKPRLLDLKTQSVPRCKHVSTQL